MTKVLRIDRKLYNLEKPPLVPSDIIGLNKGDILILCAGFEDRSIRVLNNAINSGKNDFSIVLVEYLPNVPENKTNEIMKKCSECGISVNRLLYDRENPPSIRNKLLDILHPVECRIFVDISGMSRLLIVQILNVLGNPPFNFSRSTILYSMAQEYPPSEKEVNAEISKMEEDSLHLAMFLSSGVFELAVVPELSSVSSEGQPIRVVAFPSFNPNQLAALRSEIQASSFTLIHGIPALEENAWRPDKINILNRIEDISNRDDLVVSTLEYNETLELLLDIYDKYGVLERIIIAPTGSKMQTVAVGIFRAFMEDIQIVYPTPRIFPKPKKYTAGVRQLYQLQLDSFSDIRR